MKVQSNFEELIFGYARDISTSGISVSSEVVSSIDAIPSIGQTLTLSFKLPKQEHKITVVAKLVRVDLQEGQLPVLGLAYTDLQKESKKNIEAFVNQIQMSLFNK